MSLWKTFREDMEALVPDSIKVYPNKETGEEAFEIVNKHNRFAPTRIRSYDNPKKGVSLYEATNDEPAVMENWFGKKKKLDLVIEDMMK